MNKIRLYLKEIGLFLRGAKVANTSKIMFALLGLLGVASLVFIVSEGDVQIIINSTVITASLFIYLLSGVLLFYVLAYVFTSVAQWSGNRLIALSEWYPNSIYKPELELDWGEIEVSNIPESNERDVPTWQINLSLKIKWGLFRRGMERVTIKHKKIYLEPDDENETLGERNNNANYFNRQIIQLDNPTIFNGKVDFHKWLFWKNKPLTLPIASVYWGSMLLKINGTYSNHDVNNMAVEFPHGIYVYRFTVSCDYRGREKLPVGMYRAEFSFDKNGSKPILKSIIRE